MTSYSRLMLVVLVAFIAHPIPVMLMCVPRARDQGLFCVAGCRLSQGVPSHPHLLLEIFSSWTVALSAAIKLILIQLFQPVIWLEKEESELKLLYESLDFTQESICIQTDVWAEQMQLGAPDLGSCCFWFMKRNERGIKQKLSLSPPETQIIISEALLRHK